MTVQPSGLPQGFLLGAANLAGMDRLEAEAIYDAGREVSSSFLTWRLGSSSLRSGFARFFEAQWRQGSRTSSKPPSSDPPKTRAQRRAEARAKAKELMRREGEQPQAGSQPAHRGAGRQLRPEDQIDEIVDHYAEACGGCGREFAQKELSTTVGPTLILCQG